MLKGRRAGSRRGPVVQTDKRVKGSYHVLSSCFTMHAVAESNRGLARQGGTIRRGEEIRCRRALKRASRARHEAVDLPDAERLRLCQSGRRLALRANSAETRGQ